MENLEGFVRGGRNGLEVLGPDDAMSIMLIWLLLDTSRNEMRAGLGYNELEYLDIA